MEARLRRTQLGGTAAYTLIDPGISDCREPSTTRSRYVAPTIAYESGAGTRVHCSSVGVPKVTGLHFVAFQPDSANTRLESGHRSRWLRGLRERRPRRHLPAATELSHSAHPWLSSGVEGASLQERLQPETQSDGAFSDDLLTILDTRTSNPSGIPARPHFGDTFTATGAVTMVNGLPVIKGDVVLEYRTRQSATWKPTTASPATLTATGTYTIPDSITDIQVSAYRVRYLGSDPYEPSVSSAVSCLPDASTTTSTPTGIPSTVRFGTVFTATGRVTSASGAPVTEGVAYLEYKRSTGAWVRTGSTPATITNGAYSFRETVGHVGASGYRVVYVGSGPFLSSQSGEVARTIGLGAVGTLSPGSSSHTSCSISWSKVAGATRYEVANNTSVISGGTLGNVASKSISVSQNRQYNWRVRAGRQDHSGNWIYGGWSPILYFNGGRPEVRDSGSKTVRVELCAVGHLPLRYGVEDEPQRHAGTLELGEPQLELRHLRLRQERREERHHRVHRQHPLVQRQCRWWLHEGLPTRRRGAQHDRNDSFPRDTGRLRRKQPWRSARWHGDDQADVLQLVEHGQSQQRLAEPSGQGHEQRAVAGAGAEQRVRLLSTQSAHGRVIRR